MTQTQVVTSSSAKLAVTPALVVGKSYQVQNVGAQQMRFAEAATDPGTSFRGHVLDPGESMVYQPAAATSMWMWTVNTDTYVAVTETP